MNLMTQIYHLLSIQKQNEAFAIFISNFERKLFTQNMTPNALILSKYHPWEMGGTYSRCTSRHEPLPPKGW